MEHREQCQYENEDHLTLDDIRDGLGDVIDYNKTVGRLLEYLMAEVGRLARECKAPTIRNKGQNQNCDRDS